MISIHTALAGCDDQGGFDYTAVSRFQSTQPSQAVTQVRKVLVIAPKFQSTQPSQAVTRGNAERFPGMVISIHTALAGCDDDL